MAAASTRAPRIATALSVGSSPATLCAMALLAVALCSGAARAGILINEVDYDQPGTDTKEFIELYNNDVSGSYDLSAFSLVLVNGSNSLEYGRIALPSMSFEAGQFFVVCGAGSGVGNCNFEVSPGPHGFIQNGSPDGIALLHVSTGTVMDSLSYEGAIGAAQIDGVAGTVSLVNGTALSPSFADSGTDENVGLSRFPNGRDTGDDVTDWRVASITPGAPNASGVMASIPESENYAMMLIGLGFMGFLARRRALRAS